MCPVPLSIFKFSFLIVRSRGVSTWKLPGITLPAVSNQPFSNWGEVFGDQIIASAILDRVLHHAISVNIKGESYRLKEKLKAGLLAKHTEQP